MWQKLLKPRTRASGGSSDTQVSQAHLGGLGIAGTRISCLNPMWGWHFASSEPMWAASLAASLWSSPFWGHMNLRDDAPTHLFRQHLLLKVSPQTSSPIPRTPPGWGHTYTLSSNFLFRRNSCRNLPGVKPVQYVNSQVMLFIMQQFNPHVAPSHGFSRKSLFTIQSRIPSPCLQPFFCC